MRHGTVPAQLRPVELQFGEPGRDGLRFSHEAPVGFVRVLLLKVVARAEYEEGQTTRPQLVFDADLVVPVVERIGARKGGKKKPCVGIAARHRHGALAVVEGRGRDTARVEQSHVGRYMQAIRLRGDGIGRDDAGDIPSKVHRVAAGKEFKILDKEGVNDRGAEGEVEKRGRTHPVDEKTSVAWVGAANSIKRQRPRRLCHARQRFYNTEGIAKRAGGVGQFLFLEGYGGGLR